MHEASPAATGLSRTKARQRAALLIDFDVLMSFRTTFAEMEDNNQFHGVIGPLDYPALTLPLGLLSPATDLWLLGT